MYSPGQAQQLQQKASDCILDMSAAPQDRVATQITTSAELAA